MHSLSRTLGGALATLRLKPHLLHGSVDILNDAASPCTEHCCHVAELWVLSALEKKGV